MSFVSEKDVPRPVIRARNRDQISNLDNDWRGERIIQYSKEIVLFKNAFDGIFDDTPQFSGINDIMRYSIRSYLTKMDEPYTVRNSVNGDQLAAVTCHRVYHLNVISRYRSVLPQKEKFTGVFV